MAKSQTLPAPQQNGNGAGKPKDLQVFLQNNLGRVADVLPPSLGLSPERLVKLACMTIHKRADLQRCSQISVLSSVLEAASLGLEIGGALAEAHLIPYGNECQFQPDYKGLLKLARRSGEFEAIEAVDVFERDIFRVLRTPAPTIQHELYLDGDAGPVRYVYGYAVLKGGHIVFEVMNRSQVEAVRAISKSANGPAWKNHWGEMAKKVVLKRLLKRQSRSVDVARAIDADNREYVMDATATVARQGGARGVAGLRQQLAIEADGPTLPPQPSTIYSEPDDSYDAPEVDDMQQADEPQTPPETRKGRETGSLPLGQAEPRRTREPGEEG